MYSVDDLYSTEHYTPEPTYPSPADELEARFHAMVLRAGFDRNEAGTGWEYVGK